MALKQRRNFPSWPLSTGQKDFGPENDIMNKDKRG